MRLPFALAATLAMLTLTAPAFAQDSTSADAAAAGYQAAMHKMHMDMGEMQPSGNADVDFVRAMIPHHQAAIDMAKVQLEYGKDPEIRKLSEAVITAQTREIKEMQDWLAKHAPN